MRLPVRKKKAAVPLWSPFKYSVSIHSASLAHLHVEDAQRFGGPGGLEGVPKRGAGEAVDDGVQHAVQVGERDRHVEDLGDPPVGDAVLRVDLLDVKGGEAGGDPRQEADGVDDHDEPQHLDGALHLLLPVQLAESQDADGPSASRRSAA